LPTTDKLIDITLYSDCEDEVFAACRTLADDEEIRKQDFRLVLIERLEKLSNNERRKKILNLLDFPRLRTDKIFWARLQSK